MTKKIIIPLLSVLLLAVTSCNDKEPDYPTPQPEPQPYVEHPCPKAGDIFKIYPDTFFVSQDGLYITNENKLIRLHYEGSTSFALMTCEGKYRESSSAANSPLSWKIKPAGQEDRDIVYAMQGTILINRVLLPEDLDKMMTFKDGEKMEYSASLLNFDEKTIQTNTITFIYKQDLQP